MQKTLIPLSDIHHFDSEDEVAKQKLLKLFSQAHGFEVGHFKVLDTSLCLHYDPSLVSLTTIKAQLATLGYQLSAIYQTLTLSISTLDSSDSVTVIEHELNHTPGILAVCGSYTTGAFRIEFNTNLIKADAIQQKISELGFNWSSTTVDHPHTSTHAPKHTHGHNCGSDLHADHGHSHGDDFWAKYRELGLSLVTGLLWLSGLISHYWGYKQLATSIWLIAYLPGGIVTLIDSVRALIQKRFNIESLMIFAAIGAGLLGKLSEGVLLLFLFSLGHALEHFALGKARRSIKSLTEIAPKKALIKLERGITQEVLVEDLIPGQIVVVKPGQAIPADGKISLGSSNINQAAITGESIPVSKTVEDEVFAGTLNGEGLIEVTVTKPVSESTLAKMLRLITEADAQKSGTQRFAEKFERIFVPVVLIGVLLIAFLPYWFGVMKLHDSIFMALVVLVSASPCALALATPVAVLVGISRAAKDGILIKGGAALENLGYTKVIAFDKTGTLTEGKPEIVEVINLSPMEQNQMLGLIMGLEHGSAHPLAISIIKYGQTQRIQALAVDNIQNVDGKGIQGSYLGKSLRLGSQKMFEFIPAQIAAIIDRLEQSGNTTMLLALDDELIGIIALADRVRVGASQALTSLKQLGILKSVMLTGDNETVAKVIGQELNIDEIRASLLPEEKVQQIQMLTQEYNYIAMIGDGVNDAPAMANASVGIAMGGTKTDVAIETSDIVLMNDNLTKLPLAISLSKATNRIIRQNLFISLGVVVVLVTGGLLSITNIVAAVGIHEGSSLFVIFNALRLLYFRPKTT